MPQFNKGDQVILTIPGASAELREVLHQSGKWVLIRRASTGTQWTYEATDLALYEPEVCSI